MKKNYKIFIIIMLFSLTAFTSYVPVLAEENNSSFYIDGNILYDVNDQPFIMRGVNYPHTWFKNQLEIAIPAIAATGANTVRIVLSDGTQWSRDLAPSVKRVLDICEKHKLITVLEVHDATGKNDLAALNKAVNYWISIKEVLFGKEDRVIINIANEWYGNWSGEEWAGAYKEAIGSLREAGFKHTIMVDSAGWGQYPTSIHQYGVSILESDPLRNIIFSIHFYEYSGKNSFTIRQNIDNVLNKGLALCVGEFGWKHTDGDVDEDYILEYTEKKAVGWLAWSWKGNGGGVEYLDLAEDWAGKEFTPWGERIVYGENGLKETSELASIFLND